MEKSHPAAPLKRVINQAFAEATNKEQLQYNLFQGAIGVVYRENAVGRLYGITFIDHNTGVVLNDSSLGKEYTANAIVDRLENSHNYDHLTNAAQSQVSGQFTPQQQPLPSQETQPIYRTEQHSESSSIGGSIGLLFDIPILPNGDDPEEKMFRRRMQKKKKKGRGL